jgi:hypothetical protein
VAAGGVKRPLMTLSRAKILAKTQGRCAYCGVPLKGHNWERDHVKPLVRFHNVRFSFGGRNGCKNPEHHTADNLVAACKPCNRSKGACDLESWRASLKWLGATPLKPVVFWFERLAAQKEV